MDQRKSYKLIKSSFKSQAIFYLIALAVAEILTALSRPWAGMALHGFILILLILHASLGAVGLRQRFLLALALTPLVRVISLALILQKFPPVVWYSAVGVPLFLAAFLTARQSRLNKAMLGLSLHGWPFQLFIALAGLGLGFVEYLILRPQPLVSDFGWQPVALMALTLLLLTGLLEELIFRGIIQYTALASQGRFSLLYVPALSAVLYLSLRPGPDLLIVFGTALLFGKVVQHTGSILGASLSRGLMNTGLFLVFPLLLARPAATPVTVSTQGLIPAYRTAFAPATAPATARTTATATAAASTTETASATTSNTAASTALPAAAPAVILPTSTAIYNTGQETKARILIPYIEKPPLRNFRDPQLTTKPY